MTKREQLKQIKKETKKEKLNRNLYASSALLFLFTITMNLINIIYNPYLLNGLILEINIAIIIYCLYSWIKTQRKITLLKEEELNLRIKTILTNLE